jgi:hypothetical protein
MYGKLKSLLIVSILILSALVISTSFGSMADAPPEELGARGPPGGSNYTWMPILVPSEPVSGQDFNTETSNSVRLDAENGHIYVVWDDMNNTDSSGTDSDIFYRHFNGNSWSDIEVISEPIVGANTNSGPSYDPSIAVENGKIYVVWEDNYNLDGSGTDYDIFFRCNLGSGWEDLQVVSEPSPGNNFNTGNSEEADIEVENGNIYITWDDTNQTDSSGGDQDIHYRTNLTGTSWDDIQVVSEPAAGKNFNTGSSRDPIFAVDNGMVYVSWEDTNGTYGSGTDSDIFVRCNLTGNGWEPVQVVSEPNLGGDLSTGSSFDHGFAADDGKIYVAWEESWDYNGAGTDEDIFYRCNITGTSWEPIQVISEPVFGQNFDTRSEDDPKVAAENGMVCVIFGNSNNTNNANTDYDIATRFSYNGQDWEDIDIVSEPEFGKNFNTASNSYYSWVAIDNRRIVAAWAENNNTDNSGGDNDINLRYTNLAPEFFNADVTPNLGNTSTVFNFTVTLLDRDNDKPKYIKVGVSGKNMKMNEVNPLDTNYKNGKDYWVESTHLNVKTHNTKFFAGDGWNLGTYWLNSEPVVVNTPPNIVTANDKTAPEDVLLWILKM